MQMTDTQLMQLADRNGTSFERVLKRYQAGERDEARLVGLHPITRDWMLPADAARMLHASPSAMLSINGDLKKAVRYKSRSLRPGASARGAGGLYYRPDIEMLARIKRECHIGLRQAARVMAWLNEAEEPK